MARLPVPLLNVCCFNVCLRTATLIIGYVAMLASLYAVVHNTVIAGVAMDRSNDREEINMYLVERDYSHVRFSFAILSGINFYVGLLVIIGGWKDIPSYILIWLCFSCLYVVCTFGYLVTMVTVYVKKEAEATSAEEKNEYHSVTVVMAIMAVVVPGLSIYFLIVVYSYYQTFKLTDRELSEKTEAIEMQDVSS